MKLTVSSIALAFITLFPGNGALLAQAPDVAAAARASRASGGAQEPQNALRTCLADNTSGRDRKDLARWVFFAMAAHPEMKQYADAKATAAADETSQKMAALVTRLLTESCVGEVRAVVKTGQGAQSLKLAFESLGQLAMQELVTDKNVQDAMASFQRYVDETHLRDALAGN
jgi:hypothetical protein